LVGILGAPVGCTQEGSHAGSAGAGWITAAVALDLTEQAAGPSAIALVVDQVVDVDQVVTPVEGEPLDVIDIVLAEMQVNGQAVAALGQLITGLFDTVQRSAIGAGIGTIATGQSALGD